MELKIQCIWCMLLIQGQNNALQLENSALRGGAGGQDPVREKALNASKQLIAAANSAEQTLK